MKQLFLSIQLILISIIGFSQPKMETLIAPVIAFESETIDYGIIEQGSDGERIFTFTNTSMVPLIISQAKKTCGCTVPSWPKEPIKPGESSSIKVKYDTNRLGAFAKTVIIFSNAERKTIDLHIKGKIVAKSTVPSKPKQQVPVAN